MAKPEILAVPPVEAVEHFRSKGYHVGFDWRDTDAAQHLASFTVAKAMRLDILEDIREAVDEAIAEGLTFAQFQRRLEPVLRSKGWWGQQELVDPVTGERRLVQLGSPHRLRTIFDTNIRMASAHGRWTRVQRLKGVMPYLRYVAVLDARTRPEHALWHGTVLPVDHPWWRTHYPPNGWHCRCIVVQLSDHDLERYGYRVSPDPDVRQREWLNRRTGEVHQVPFGIDPGFAHNVGLLDPVRHARNVAQAKHGVGAIVPERPAVPQRWQEYAIVGREVVQEIVDQLGMPRPNVPQSTYNAAFRDLFRRRLVGRLGDRNPDVTPRSRGDGAATGRVRDTVRAWVPESWIRAAPAAYVHSNRKSSGGFYRHSERLIDVSSDLGNALHEYIHHLQYTVPGFHAAWRQFFVDRTTLRDGSREAITADSDYGPSMRRRKDRWIEDYMGRVYSWSDVGSEREGLEVLTRGAQILTYGVYGRDNLLPKLLTEDPEFLHFLVGFWLRFDPEGS